jgi:hypothetical protein
MQYMKARKLATGMLVAFLLLSSLALLPSVTVKAASASGAILSFNVVDNSNTPVAGATATLTETHTSKVYTNTTDASGLVTFSPLPGYYIMKISKTGFFDLEYSSIVKFDGITSLTLGLVQIANIPAGSGTLALSVIRASGGTPVVGSLKLIDLNSPTKMEKVYAFSGSLNLALYPSSYRMVISANGLETDVSDITIANGATNTQPISLVNAVVLNGFVYKAGAPGTAVKAVLVSTNTGLVAEKRIIQARVTSNYFEFDAYAGSFTLMVDAADSLTAMSSVTLSIAQTITVNLNAQSAQTDTSNIAFGNGWNWFNLTRNIAMDFDTSWPNIAYSFIPNLRMQIDFAFGTGDGTVSATDYNLFLNKVRSFGPVNVTSDYVVKVNGTKYAVNQDFTTSAFTGLSGTSVLAVTGYTGSFVTPYKSLTNLVDNLSVYTAQGYVKYDTNSLNYKTVLSWPSAYEMTANSTQTTYVKVTGYLTVTLDALVRPTGYFEQVTMTVQKSVAPTAVGGVQVPSTYAYAVTSGSNVLHYIVSTQRNIVFTGNGSSDPNGNPLKYTWAFGDGQRAENVTTAWTTHNYSAAAFNLTVVMKAYDVAGLSASKTFYIKTDGIVPIPDFTVRNHTVATSPMRVNQNEALVFNGASSVDHIASTSDVGVIKTWNYVWGDGNVTTVGVGENQNVTKTYARAGTFTMMLNVTDAAGHVATKSIQIVVKDKTAPVVSFVIQRNGTSVVTALENQTLVLTANATVDVNDTFSSLNFTWSFGDGKTGYGAWVRHNFSAIKTFSVKLSARDVAGNVANLTKSLTITSSARPDLRVVSMVFSPTTFTEGDRGIIKVNVSNVGNDIATFPHLEFYVLTSDGKKSFIGNETAFTVNGTTATTLNPGQYGIFSFGWAPSSRGNFTVQVNAVAEREINKADNTDTSTVVVNEAAWKAIALYGGIFAVIVVVIVLFYMRRRLPKLGGGKITGKKPEVKESQKGKK